MLVRESRFLISLCATWAIEAPAFLGLCRAVERIWPGACRPKAGQPEAPRGTAFLTGLALMASALTLPYVWFVFPRYIRGPAYLPTVEAFAVLAEALFYALAARMRLRIALPISLLCNAASWAAGLLIGPLLVRIP
jgi:hypothetical protein